MKESLLSYWRGLTPLRKAAWVVIGVIFAQGLYFTARRYFLGLGDVTNLTDAFPWGFWVGFDVMSGVALAAGGFTLCFLVYIFGYHRYHGIVRPTVLTAFLGYLLVSVGLMYDLGKYFNIWHPLVMWNLHSVMFEVAWCVMLYTFVLLLEFLPVVLEKLELSAPIRVLHRIAIPVVLAGVVLSTLHQSSLGSLFLVAPEKLHTLWYTPILPLLFFLSAVTVGPAMVIVESFASSKLFRRGLELDILADLARFLQVGLLLYVAVRIQDLFVRGVAGRAFEPTFESAHFLAENALFVIAIGILAVRRLRNTPSALLGAAMLVVAGVVYNRINVVWTGMLRSSGTTYWPSAGEIGISLFLVTAGGVAFFLIAKFFHVFPELDEERSAGSADGALVTARASSRTA